jgi:hypothetical protein
MWAEEVAGCCGVHAIGDLQTLSTRTPEALEEAIYHAETSHFNSEHGTQLVNLNHHQTDLIDLILKIGFKELMRTFNGNSGNTVITYGRDCTGIDYTTEED